MARQSDRFVKIYSQGSFTTLQIWVDRETGVNYLWQSSGYGGGLTPLLKPDGTPVVTPLSPRIRQNNRYAPAKRAGAVRPSTGTVG